ncbi:MAG: hypothetical protein ACO1OT_06540 [Heyndrickxia sp.]
MNLTSRQRTVLLSLTTEWQAPTQIAHKILGTSVNLSEVQQTLKDLLNAGLVQINPINFGLYRLTADGITLKQLELSKKK